MRNRLALAYAAFATLFLLAVLGQALLAGLALFWRDSLWDLHAGLGHFAPVFPMAMLLLALIGRMPAMLRPYTGLLFVGVIIQTEVFAGLRTVSGLASAYHPVLAVLLFWGGTVLARRGLALFRAGRVAEGRGVTGWTAPAAGCDAQPGLCG